MPLVFVSGADGRFRMKLWHDGRSCERGSAAFPAAARAILGGWRKHPSSPPRRTSPTKPQAQALHRQGLEARAEAPRPLPRGPPQPGGQPGARGGGGLRRAGAGDLRAWRRRGRGPGARQEARPAGRRRRAGRARDPEDLARGRRRLGHRPGADPAAHGRQPAVQGRQALGAPPPAAAGEVRRRHPVHDQVRVRAGRRPAEGHRRARRRRAPARSATRCCSASPARARPSRWPRSSRRRSARP